MKRISNTEYRIEKITRKEVLEVAKSIDVDDLFCQSDFDGDEATEIISIEVADDEWIEIDITARYKFYISSGEFATPCTESDLSGIEIECDEIDNDVLCEIEEILMS